jgi:hypothetical protein
LSLGGLEAIESTGCQTAVKAHRRHFRGRIEVAGSGGEGALD